ncbi:uroplakin-3b-like [Anomaloglossus baeobatrachus]|uniref:uroplakin-3b-like n=1 Tax=Anomaloglossus baeobatrachus TaxID=238106 RepID=UPI003F50ACFF
MQSSRTAMWGLAILVLFGVSTVHGQISAINCSPTLAASNLLGRITSSTATFDLCCVSQNPQVLPTDNVVLLVGSSSVINSLNPSTININNPPLYSNFSQSGLYAPVNSLASSLCTPNNLAGTRIGSNILCIQDSSLPFCNGPIPSLGPLSVIALVYRNGTLVAVTNSSAAIDLKNPKDYHSIDTSVKNRSAGMIVITVILPILSALLLVILTTMMFMKCCCCRAFTPSRCQQES